MIFGAAGGIATDAVEDVDDRSDDDVERRFLADFARQRSLEALADLHGAARQAPVAFQRLLPSLDQQHAIAVEDHGADGDDRPVRVVPQIPMTFTTTRFLRRPSNSA